jgi:hypothetical protein
MYYLYMLKKIGNFIKTHKELVGALVLFYIIISSSRTILHSTILGKSVLLAFILLVTCINKAAGVFAAIVLIVMYHNQSGAVFLTSNGMEGFTATKDASGNVVIDGSGNQLGAAAASAIAGLKDLKITTTKTTTTTAADPAATTTSATTEGFDLLGTEDTLRKGRQSNAVSVKKSKVDGNIGLLPFENTKYVENFLILG